MITPSTLTKIRRTFGERLQENQPLAKFTSARLGGPADALLTAESADQLAVIVSALWQLDMPFLMLGAGSNVLISDQGVAG